LSVPPLASSVPSALKLSAVTIPPCPARVKRRAPLAVSQIVIVVSGFAVASRVPPGPKAAVPIIVPGPPLVNACTAVATGAPQLAGPIRSSRAPPRRAARQGR
jgi:hypothetical protein